MHAEAYKSSASHKFEEEKVSVQNSSHHTHTHARARVHTQGVKHVKFHISGDKKAGALESPPPTCDKREKIKCLNLVSDVASALRNERNNMSALRHTLLAGKQTEYHFTLL